jgi:Holliday junction resolvase
VESLRAWPPLGLAVGLALALLACGSWLGHLWRRASARSAGRAHNLRGQRGERQAERLLRRAGYAPCGRHVRGSYAVQVGEETLEVALQADYLVERAGRRLVAEVKTGRHAPRFEHAETRRQLLEYQLAFGVESVLLVDVEAGEVREVRFPVAGGIARSRTHVVAWLLAALFAAVALRGLVR